MAHYWAGQLSNGFQGANIPDGLCAQTQTRRSQCHGIPGMCPAMGPWNVCREFGSQASVSFDGAACIRHCRGGGRPRRWAVSETETRRVCAWFLRAPPWVMPASPIQAKPTRNRAGPAPSDARAGWPVPADGARTRVLFAAARVARGTPAEPCSLLYDHGPDDAASVGGRSASAAIRKTWRSLRRVLVDADTVAVPEPPVDDRGDR